MTRRDEVQSARCLLAEKGIAPGVGRCERLVFGFSGRF